MGPVAFPFHHLRTMGSAPSPRRPSPALPCPALLTHSFPPSRAKPALPYEGGGSGGGPEGKGREGEGSGADLASVALTKRAIMQRGRAGAVHMWTWEVSWAEDREGVRVRGWGRGGEGNGRSGGRSITLSRAEPGQLRPSPLPADFPPSAAFHDRASSAAARAPFFPSPIPHPHPPANNHSPQPPTPNQTPSSSLAKHANKHIPHQLPHARMQ